MKTKKLFLGLFCLAALVLSGCDGSNSKSNDSSKPSSQNVTSSEQVVSSENQSQNSSEQSSANASSEENSSEEASSESQHVHNYEFQQFIWTETPGAYTAVAQYKCTDDYVTEIYDAVVTKDPSSVAQVCEEEHPKNVWKATYDGHSETKEETLTPIHHSWSVSTWEWTGVTSAVAHFVCAHDANHTHDETATGEKIVKTTLVEPNCTNKGSDSYTATVTFGGQNYSDTKVVDVPATGIHTKDAYGFCTSGGEYLGDTKELNTDFTVDAAVEYFFRVPIDTTQHYCFLVSGTNKQAIGTATAWIRVNDEMQSVGNLASFADEYDLGIFDYPTMINIADEKGDGYLYVKLEEADNSGIHLIMEASNEHLLDFAGQCVGGDYYEGTTEDLNTLINLGTETSPGHYEMSTDETAYYRFEAYPEHVYHLDKTHIETSEVTFYYRSKINGEWVELVRVSGSFTTPNSTAFDDGYVYCVVSPVMALSDANIKLRLIGHPDGCEDDYGFCTQHEGEYIGSTISNNGTWPDVNISSGKKDFFRFAIEEGHSYSIYDSTWEINYERFTAFLRNVTTGEMTPVEMTHKNMVNYTPVLDSVGDGYLYLVVTATGAIVNGQIDVETIHQYNNYGLCTSCGRFIDAEQLYDGSTSDPFTLEVGEKAYFFHEVERNDNPPIGIEFNDSFFGTEPSKMFVVRNDQVVELEYNGAGSTQDYSEYYMTSANALQEGEVVYIIIENNQSGTMTNWTIELSEVIY